MLIKIYTSFTISYSNLKAHDITLVLGSSGANNSTIRPFKVGVEVDNIFITIATFSSFRNYKTS